MQLVQLSVLIGASPQHCALFCLICNDCVALRKLGKNSILAFSLRANQPL